MIHRTRIIWYIIKIYQECEDRIENSVPWDDRFASQGLPSDDKRLSWRTEFSITKITQIMNTLSSKPCFNHFIKIYVSRSSWIRRGEILHMPQGGASLVDLFLLFVFRVCLSYGLVCFLQPCGQPLEKVLTSWLSCMWCFIVFLSLVLDQGQVWYLIVSIPDFCLIPYYKDVTLT